MEGTIYKITNIITHKVYIGQTKQNYLIRFSQHVSRAKTGQSKHKLANAIRKYGEDNFIVEPIENCNYELLDERERYWISFYNSKEDGYNSTDGGQDLTNYYSLPNERIIIQDYQNNIHNIVDTAKKYGITEYKMRQILAVNHIPTDFSKYGQHTKERLYVEELDMEFDSGVECARYFITNNICSSKKEQCVRTRISNCISNGKKAYGYTIKKI